MGARIERVVTSGQFELDGGSWDVDNNVWLIGDDSEVIVIDAAHDGDAILDAIDLTLSDAEKHRTALISHGTTVATNALLDPWPLARKHLPLCGGPRCCVHGRHPVRWRAWSNRTLIL